MKEHLARLVVRMSGIVALTILAACGGGSDNDDVAAATPSQPQQQPGANAAGERINLGQCTSPFDGKIYFQIGESNLSVPAPVIIDTIPANLRPPVTKEQVRSELKAQAAAGAGCPEKPLAAGLLLLKDDLQHPLLDGNIGLLSMPPGGITGKFAELTRQLQRKPTENCKPVGGDLLGCIGTESRGNVETQVMYIITTKAGENMASGGPLAARCVLRDQAVEGCNLVEQLAGNLAFDASLKAGTYSTASLREALNVAAGHIRNLRR